MKNKIFLLTIIFFFLNSCGYKPIYSTKNLNFSIGNIEKKNTSLNNQFVKVIKSIKNSDAKKKINIEIQSNKKIITKSKDKKGNALIFEIEISLSVLNLSKSDQKKQTFLRKISYKNLNDKFKLKQYESELEKILISRLVEDLIDYFSNI